MQHNLRILLLAALIPLAAHAAPPIGERLSAALEHPLRADPFRKSVSLGTTIDDAIDTDITAAQKTADKIQMFVVTNTHATQNVCFGTVAWSGADSCATRCGTAGAWTEQTGLYAATMNCTAGDASIGQIIPAGRSRAFRYDGTRCACIVASGASTTVQVERFTR